MRNTLIALSAAAMATIAVPASAQTLQPSHAHVFTEAASFERNGAVFQQVGDRYDRYDRYDRRDRRHDRRGRRVYDDYGRYYEPRRVRRGDRVWRGRDGRYYCQRDNGTTGLIIGAAGGALLGREIDGGRDRTVGTILGAALGGLLGREIDRGNARCR